MTCKIFLAKTISKTECLVDIFRRQHYMHPLGKRLGTFGPFKCLELQFVLHSLPTSVVSECAGILSTKTFVWWTVYNSSHGQSNSQSWCSDAVTQKFLLTLMPSPFFFRKAFFSDVEHWNSSISQVVTWIRKGNCGLWNFHAFSSFPWSNTRPRSWISLHLYIAIKCEQISILPSDMLSFSS